MKSNGYYGSIATALSLCVLASSTLIGCASLGGRTTTDANAQEPAAHPTLPETTTGAEQTPQQPQASEPPANTVQLRPARPAAASAPRASNPATLALRSQAKSALDEQDYPTATRLLERALRIDPKDAATYYLFAQLRIEQEQPSAAMQLIDKGLSLRPDTELEKQLSQLKANLASP